MPSANQNSADKLCAEVLATARCECEEIIGHAKTEAAAFLAGAKTEADRIRRERREQALAEATRRKELILATVAVETGRMRSARVETLLASVHAEIRRRLRAKDSDGRETVVALAAEAIGRMPENNLVLEISAADHAAMGNGLVHEITQRTGRPRLNLIISINGMATDGGVVVRDNAGLQVWDNRLLSRLDRLWPELRRQIAVQASLLGENHSGSCFAQ